MPLPPLYTTLCAAAAFRRILAFLLPVHGDICMLDAPPGKIINMPTNTILYETRSVARWIESSVTAVCAKARRSRGHAQAEVDVLIGRAVCVRYEFACPGRYAWEVASNFPSGANLDLLSVSSYLSFLILLALLQRCPFCHGATVDGRAVTPARYLSVRRLPSHVRPAPDYLFLFTRTQST